MIYSHSGDDGDVIYSLASLRQIGGVELRLTPSTCIVRSGYEPSKAERLARLIRLQPYIRACSYASRKEQHDGGWINCDGFRGCYKGSTILDWQSDYLGLGNITHGPWLTVPSPKQISEVVIHRSPRYHNDNFPWWDVSVGFAGRVVMVGSVEEHAQFCSRYGHVPYHPTRDFLELAQVIAGSNIPRYGRMWLRRITPPSK